MSTKSHVKGFWYLRQLFKFYIVFIYFLFACFFVNLANMSGIDTVFLCRQVIPSATNKTACIQNGVVFISLLKSSTHHRDAFWISCYFSKGKSLGESSLGISMGSLICKLQSSADMETTLRCLSLPGVTCLALLYRGMMCCLTYCASPFCYELWHECLPVECW